MTDLQRLQRYCELSEHGDFLRSERDRLIRTVYHAGQHSLRDLETITGLSKTRLSRIVNEGKGQ